MKNKYRTFVIIQGITLLMFTSCAIRISEKAALGGQTQVRYDSLHINRYTAGVEDNDWLEAIRSLPNHKKNVFYSSDSLTVVREYLHVNDSITLEYFVISPLRPTQTVYAFSGYGALSVGLFPSLMELSKSRDAKVICLSYSGYGLSTGHFSIQQQFDYNQFFYNRLKQDNIGRVSALGYSMGSIYASALAADNALDQLVLLAPISDAADFAKQMKKQGMRGGYSLLRPFVQLRLDSKLQRISNVAQLQRFAGKVFIFHAKDDRTLPFSMSEKLYRWSVSKEKRLVLVDEGGHGAPFVRENWREIRDSW
jgi:pimeloyl-ACP methyl ester carboxylesterase